MEGRWRQTKVVGRADHHPQGEGGYSGRWMHVCATLGPGGRHLDIQVVYGIPNQRALNEAFWELVLCYTSCVTPADLATPAKLSSGMQFLISISPIACLWQRSAGGTVWLVDADLLHSRLRGTKCASVFSKDGHTHTHAQTAP